MRLLAILTIFLCSVSAFAQDIIGIPASAIGSGNIISASMHNDVSNVNPANMALVKNYGAMLSYTIPYFMGDFQQIQAKFVGHTEAVNIEGLISRNGNDNSAYTQFGAGISRDFRHFGIGLEYYGVLHQLPYSQHAFSSYSRFGLFFCQLING